MAEANKIIGKVIITIEVEIEKEIPDLGGEVCRRITMHPHVKDANVCSYRFYSPEQLKFIEQYGIEVTSK